MPTYERRFEKLPEDQKLSKLCSEASLNLVGAKNQSSCREFTLPRVRRKIVQKGGKKAMHGLVLSQT